ncbi:MAG: thiamine ABC transporter substrate-binding protein [Gaiellaceae bacterium]
MRRVVAAAVAIVIAGAASGIAAPSTGQVALVTHDSFAISKATKAAFEKQSGLKLRILQNGDAGAALNRALLTAGKPEGDVFFGVDNNLLSRALGGKLFDSYSPEGLTHVDRSFDLDRSHRLVPVDHGAVCLVYDRAWFATHAMKPPSTFEDLLRPGYAKLTVVENPATSTPGLAFMLATIAHFGRGNGPWTYWRAIGNGVLVTNGWEEAYNTQFSGSSSHKGNRPIVVSYSSDPAAEVYFAGKPLTQAPVAVVRNTCFGQTEFAGVLRGARNADGARRLVDFLLSPRFQAGIPLTMFVYPVREKTPLPAVFRKFSLPIASPLQLAPATIGANRDAWIRTWTTTVLR